MIYKNAKEKSWKLTGCWFGWSVDSFALAQEIWLESMAIYGNYRERERRGCSFVVPKPTLWILPLFWLKSC